jgi:hypothetical protein
MGWLRDFSVQQLQELLQTYFGAMRHCLVCGPTVDATNFAADSISTYGILWDSIHESHRTQERLTTKQQNERQTEEAYSFVIDQSIDDSGPDLAS